MNWVKSDAVRMKKMYHFNVFFYFILIFVEMNRQKLYGHIFQLSSRQEPHSYQLWHYLHQEPNLIRHFSFLSNYNSPNCILNSHSRVPVLLAPVLSTVEPSTLVQNTITPICQNASVTLQWRNIMEHFMESGTRKSIN